MTESVRWDCGVCGKNHAPGDPAVVYLVNLIPDGQATRSYTLFGCGDNDDCVAAVKRMGDQAIEEIRQSNDVYRVENMEETGD